MTPRDIRVLQPAEVERLVEWAVGEGWNPGLADAAAFRAADPEGFLGAFVDGEMVAGISAVRYGSGYGFVGLYICRRDARGQGHGKAVWQAGMTRLAGRIIGLDGVDAQVENYRRKGFVTAYRTIRFGGHFSAGVGQASSAIAPLSTSDMSEVAAFDRRTFPETRQAFLEKWLAPPHVVKVARSNGQVAGYGVMRQCGIGWKVGGLSAIDPATAAAILVALAHATTDEVFIDVPELRTDFIGVLGASGLVPGFETTRMYHGGTIPLAAELYGVTTLELG
jgi:ribosomal protein S18 acetylase RimI-like enzyme